jgi:hypothetical protein
MLFWRDSNGPPGRLDIGRREVMKAVGRQAMAGQDTPVAIHVSLKVPANGPERPLHAADFRRYYRSFPPVAILPEAWRALQEERSRGMARWRSCVLYKAVRIICRPMTREFQHVSANLNSND